MTVTATLSEFRTALVQCDSLIANAHKADAAGAPFFPAIDREQITTAAFLNMFIAWEKFLEDTLAHLMAGAQTISGNSPTKYVSPTSHGEAKTMVVGTQRYFDYA